MRAHPETLFALGAYAMFLYGKGGEHLPEAETEMRHTLSECERVYGRDGPQAAVAKVRLARFLANEGKPADAEGRAQSGKKKLLRENFGPEHPLTTLVMFDQALSVFKTGNAEDARRLMEQVLEADEKCFLPDSVEIAQVLFHLGVVAPGRLPGWRTRSDICAGPWIYPRELVGRIFPWRWPRAGHC